MNTPTDSSTRFVGFPKMARLSRECVITEKIDGTNAQILITEDGDMFAGSRTRWIFPSADNFGFARWVEEHRDELLTLGPGRHFGEWWGQGIQRKYGMGEKRFSLFNVSRWRTASDEADERELLPSCCHLVPVLYRGLFDTRMVDIVLRELAAGGSKAAPGFMNPEGVVVFHLAGLVGFKKTLDNEDAPKGPNPNT